jgi:hypothetical protein
LQKGKGIITPFELFVGFEKRSNNIVQIIVMNKKTRLIFENLQINFTLLKNDKTNIENEKSIMNKKHIYLIYAKRPL